MNTLLRLAVSLSIGLIVLEAAASTSYDRFKSIGLVPQTLPRADLAHAYLDIDGDGVPELFSAEQRYSFSQTPETATPARFMFYQRQADGSYVERPDRLPNGTDGCIHPRKAVVADFNGDGKLDVFVACHGWDRAPFPGEHSKVVLSQPDGSYRIQNASDDVGFFHSAAAADFNSDGKTDVVVTNNMGTPSVQVWLNDGSGHFTRSAGYLPAALNVRANFFTVETPDVDGDGKFDLFVGGHEFENAPPMVLINPGNNDFSGATPVTLPAVPNEGVVLDIVASGSVGARELWVLRTSGGDGTFYQSATVQRVTWPGLSSSVPLLSRGAPWVPWIIPAVINGQNVLVSDNKAVTTVWLPITAPQASAPAPTDGLWVINAEAGASGRGFQIEVRHGTLVFTYYGYDGSGNGLWALSAGSMSGSSFSGSMDLYRGGTTLGGVYTPAIPSGSAGTVNINFSSPTTGTITFPGEAAKSISKFEFNGTNAPNIVPTNGLWVVNSEAGAAGRGFQIEHRNGVFILTFYGYLSGGSQIWTLIAGNMTASNFSGTMNIYRGGTVLGSTYHAATPAGSVGTVSINFTSSTAGTITFPGESPKAISKFMW